MKTLVIHPKDKTTDFLSVIYADKDWTIINSTESTTELKKQILLHDRIIMMGHGTPQGLLGYGRYVINSEWVYTLRSKECICIWCNADQFVKKYELKGFHTGMIISEYEEALYCDVKCIGGDVEFSNKLFAESLKKSIDGENMLDLMVKNYAGENNTVIDFNRERLYGTINKAQ